MKESVEISMEEILKLIRENLTGDYERDLNFLNSLYEEENNIIENANTTIEAINIVAKEIEENNTDNIEENNETNEEIEEEETYDAETVEEIDSLIDTFFSKIDEEDVDTLLSHIENIINKIESLSDMSDDSKIYCSFSNEIERRLFEKILAGDKEIVITPYKNDELYIIYANLLEQKKRKSASLDALNRAIFWNFLNREAREKKLEILHSRNQIVKYLDNLKVLQQISYTPVDLSRVYDLYGEIFDELNDKKASYASYKLSNYYFNDPQIQQVIASLEEKNPEFKELTDDELFEHLRSNEVQVGPNPKIIKAHRDITTEFLNEGRLDDAQILLQNDYNLTRDPQIALLYNQLLEVKEKQKEMQDAEAVVPEKPKRTRTTAKKKTTTKKEVAKTKKKEPVKKKAKTTTTKKVASKKTTKKVEEKKKDNKKDSNKEKKTKNK